MAPLAPTLRSPFLENDPMFHSDTTRHSQVLSQWFLEEREAGEEPPPSSSPTFLLQLQVTSNLGIKGLGKILRGCTNLALSNFLSTLSPPSLSPLLQNDFPKSFLSRNPIGDLPGKLVVVVGLISLMMFRLKTLSPVSYAEIRPKTNMATSKSNEIHIKEGSQPEIYTEADAKLLGDSESNWILGVDGYGQNGKRVYDSVNGESCHQCRQKTLGHRTHCSNCKLGQGQVCGDCLCTRYGENVMEVSLNLNWICPVCRGICNCSLCRQSKGWMPTGAIYRKVLNLGFKSVAHYLIQTRCDKTNRKGSSSEHVGAGDILQENTRLENNPQKHDDSLSSVDSLDIECIME